MSLPQLFHVVTAIALLLVRCHAGDKHERLPGKPGQNGLPGKDGRPGLKGDPPMRGNFRGYPPRYLDVLLYSIIVSDKLNSILLHFLSHFQK